MVQQLMKSLISVSSRHAQYGASASVDIGTMPTDFDDLLVSLG